ncbi:MAG: hypothetical protein QG650_910 [Patescibacteria group bacterium]|nr:hypothetical protein [Patescibacteria group bacterium]
MSDLDLQIPAIAQETAPAFVSEALSNVLDRTHEAAGNIVNFDEIEAREVGIRALLRTGNVLRWFRSGVTEVEIAEYAGIIDALTRKREELVATAANDEEFRKAA